jgi:hypothetical protein
MSEPLAQTFYPPLYIFVIFRGSDYTYPYHLFLRDGGKNLSLITSTYSPSRLTALVQATLGD